MMKLGPNDVHFVASRSQRTLTGWDVSHNQVFRCEARNETVADGFGHLGHCPPGEFKLGAPQDLRAVPFGFHFTPVLDLAPGGPMAQWHRGGIGVHGGGSGLPDPFAGHQGFQVTEGCFRISNDDNARFVLLVRSHRAKGGACFFTVTD